MCSYCNGAGRYWVVDKAWPADGRDEPESRPLLVDCFWCSGTGTVDKDSSRRRIEGKL